MQFSGIHSGWSKRTPVMSRNTPVDGGDQAESDERIGQIVVALAGDIEVAGLFPEAMDVGGRRGAAGSCFSITGRSTGFAKLGGLRARHLLVRDLLDFVEAAAHHAHVVFDDARALLAELVFELRFDGFEQCLLVEVGLLHHRRRGEERALERVALHAELQFGIGGLFARDLERVEAEYAGCRCR